MTVYQLLCAATRPFDATIARMRRMRLRVRMIESTNKQLRLETRVRAKVQKMHRRKTARVCVGLALSRSLSLCEP